MNKTTAIFWGDLRIAMCGAILMSTSFGIVYSMAVLFPRLHRELHIPFWRLAACFSGAGAIYFSLGLVGGAIIDRFGTARIVRCGQLILVVGLLIISLTHDEFWFDTTYIITVGLGVGMTFVPVTGAVQVLCAANSTLAASITSAGIGLGSLALPPIAAMVLRTAGWQAVLWVLAGCALVASLAATPLSCASGPGPPAQQHMVFSTGFKLLYAAQTLASLVAFVPFAHVVTWVTVHHGMTMAQGVELISSLGIGSTLGRLGLVALGARFRETRVGATCSLLMAFSMIAINVVVPHLWSLAVLMFVFGAAYGGFNALLGPLAMKICGKAHVGRAVGVLATTRAIGMLLGPWTVGVTAMWWGSYSLPFVGCGLIALMSATLMVLLDHRMEVQ